MSLLPDSAAAEVIAAGARAGATGPGLGSVFANTGLFPALLVYPLVGALLAVPVEASGESLGKTGWSRPLRAVRSGVLGYLIAAMLLLAAMPGPGWRTDVPHSRIIELVPLRALLGLDAGGGALYAVRWWHLAAGVLFVPFALLLVLRPAGALRIRSVLLISAGFALLLECVQYVLGVNRVSSVDDVLVSLLGAALGALIGHGVLALAQHGR